MPWKTDSEGVVSIENGNPVLVHSDGKEVSVDGDQLFAKISDLNTESAGRRRQLREAEGKLKVLDGIDDISDFVAKANKALDTVKNLDDKKLIDAGEVERVKAEVVKSFQAQLDDSRAETNKAVSEKNSHILNSHFAGSKFIEDKVAPAAKSLLASKFGPFFTIKDGEVSAADSKGNEIFSRVEPGEIAGFDEALEILIGNDPHRDDILKSETKSGSGMISGDRVTGKGKSLTRAQFDGLSPLEKTAFMKDGGKVTD